MTRQDTSAPTCGRVSSAAIGIAAALLMLGWTNPGHAAPFTPGNIVVADASTTTDNVPDAIRLTEYDTNGGLVQSIVVPQGKTAGSSTTMFQINFSNVDSQLVYIATAFTNHDASTNAGYVRYNGATGTVDESAVGIGFVLNGAMRGVASHGCDVFLISGSGLNRITGGVASAVTGNSNNRYGEFLNGEMYYSAGGGTTGIHRQSADHSTDTTIIPSATVGSSNLAGLHVPASDTVYVCVLGAAGGIHKVKDIAGVWTDLGTNSTVIQGNDLDSIVVSGTTRTLYALGGGSGVGGNTLYKLTDDTSDNTAATWQSASATAIVTGLVGARSVAVVPDAFSPPTFTVDVTTSGNGSVNKNPAGPNYTQCSYVTLTAVPQSGNTFINWTGDVTSGVQTGNPLTVLADSNRNIVANFQDCSGGICKTLVLSFIGNGKVNANPPSLDYASPGPHNIVLGTGTNVTLSATATPGWVFDHWEGDLTGNTASQSITLDADKAVTAVFKQLFTLQTFFTGNGSTTVNSPPPVDFTTSGTPLPRYVDGTVLNVTANPGSIGSQQAFWTFVEFHDNSLTQLAATQTANITITGNLQLTARFAEIPLNATPQPFTPGNLITGEMRDFPPTGAIGSLIQLREYNTNGRLVQPVIDMNTAGHPGGFATSALSATIFQIAVDPQSNQHVYAAAARIDNVLPARVGVVRNAWCGTAHTDNFSASVQSTAEGRGVAVNDNNVFFAYDGGIRRVNKVTGDVSSLPNSGNARNLKIFNGNLYVSTASGSAPYGSGPGIYRVDNADSGTNQTYTQIISTGASTNPIDFAFSDINHVYVGFSTGGGIAGLHKYVSTDSGVTYTDLGQNFNLVNPSGADFGRGIVTVVNGDDVDVYVMASKAASDSHLVRIDQLLSDDDSFNWQFLDVATDIVPEVSRGRALAIVPSGCSLMGPINCDYLDCNTNGTSDDCETDSNSNGRADACEDCNNNGTLDPSEADYADCNTNITPDFCEMVDCNTNDTLDVCDNLTDCDTNSTPDICELVDCNTNTMLDVCDGNDANTNGTPDECEIVVCPVCTGDINGDGFVDGDDIAGWVRCQFGSPQGGDYCSCSTSMTTAQFINKLLTDLNTACP